jgi:hypothetical protein
LTVNSLIQSKKLIFSGEEIMGNKRSEINGPTGPNLEFCFAEQSTKKNSRERDFLAFLA